MTSLLKHVAQNPSTISPSVTFSGGNGSNDTTQLSIVTIDPRYGNVFVIDTSSLRNNGALQYRVHIKIQSAKANLGKTLAGKRITLVFKLPPYVASSSTTGITVSFDSSLGSIPALATSGYFSPSPVINLVADGNMFNLESQANDWGFV